MIIESARPAHDSHRLAVGISSRELAGQRVAIARAVWSNSPVLARLLCGRTELGRRHLRIVDRSVSLISTLHFQADYDRYRAAAAREEVDHIARKKHDSLPVRERRRKIAKQRALEKQLSLWNPISRAKLLDGLIVGQNTITDFDSIIAELGKQWADTFAAKPVADGRLFAEKSRSFFDFASVAPPTVDDYSRFLALAPSSAPGPDGVPYRAWRLAGRAAAVTLWHAGWSLMQGGLLDLDFNNALQIGISKKALPGDSSGFFREPLDLRSLGLKNSDAKSIGGVATRKLSREAARGLHPFQRGFVQN